MKHISIDKCNMISWSLVGNNIDCQWRLAKWRAQSPPSGSYGCNEGNRVAGIIAASGKFIHVFQRIP